MCAFIGLNPSTADESVNDPTVRRCIEFARDWGYGGMYMLNAFAFRATDPRVMKAHSDPVGADNDRALMYFSGLSMITIAAWGCHGAHQDRHSRVIELIPNLHCLGITKHGFPKHPLYLRADLRPMPYPMEAYRARA
jgi:hypothetical protein